MIWRSRRLVASIFQSTLPVRGATVVYVEMGGQAVISIHAPRAGSDAAMDALNQLID